MARTDPAKSTSRFMRSAVAIAGFATSRRRLAHSMLKYFLLDSGEREQFRTLLTAGQWGLRGFFSEAECGAILPISKRIQSAWQERKSLVSEALARETRRYARGLLELDEHGVGRPGGAYPVHSIVWSAAREEARRIPTVLGEALSVWSGAVVVGKKFTDALADWCINLVRTFDLRQCGAAKYAQSVSLMGGTDAAAPAPPNPKPGLAVAGRPRGRCAAPGVGLTRPRQAKAWPEAP